ncbi:TATA box-binding protein-associated factor RNA polymerase I subunit D isoform X2 [Melanerpes formicivorus]|uniref:TATA box-binding protein-associated factor RNA polymerase I subunit D isoform X2 n=1 Tax=Melanerpes formicivorus TaxID=211600 RepID=UPI00358E0483
MTDAAESQSSDSDYPDAQELIGSQQKGPRKAHACEGNARLEHSRSRQKNAAAEESPAEPSSIHESAASAEVLLVSSDSEMDLSAARGSECRPECSTAPSKHKMRLRSSRRQTESVVEVSDSESSSDSSPPPLVRSSETPQKQKSKLNLKAILAYHFRGKKFRAAAHRKYRIIPRKKKKKRERTPREEPLVGRRLTASPQEQRRRLLHRGCQFPFVQEHYGRKHIPLRMVLDYEQAAAKGYFQYIEMLKYEDHLKKALKTLQASEDLERQCLSVRKHKYLDDEGPISPIQETNDDDNLNSDNPEQFDARVVENSSFIISSKIPSKKKSKRAKSTKVIEVEDDCLCC